LWIYWVLLELQWCFFVMWRMLGVLVWYNNKDFAICGEWWVLVWNICNKGFDIWVKIHSKEPTWLFKKKIVSLFLFPFIFSHERIFELNLLQLVIKNTYSCPNISFVFC
jgi:hypothetical protein